MSDQYPQQPSDQPGGQAQPPPPTPPPPPPPPPPGAQPPLQPQAASAQQWHGPPLAEWPKRVGAFAIDNIAAFIAVFIAAFIVGAVVEVLGLLLALVGYLGAFGFALYNAYLAGETGQSIGKKQMGIRLVSQETGQHIGGGMGIARYFVHIVDSIPCYIGYLWPLWDPYKQTFADKILKTVVIDQ